MSTVGATGEAAAETAIPAPVPPDDPDAWYAPAVRSQTEVAPGVVVTIRAADEGFRYEVREPGLTASDQAALDSVAEYFADAGLERPRTREGAVERMAEGFDSKHRTVIDRLVSCTPAARRRVEYHALRDLACLGELTPYALDDRIAVGDVTDGSVLVHTDEYAPATTDLAPETPYLGRFASERIHQHTVSFYEFDVPVVLYRENLLGDDPFAVKYAVREPDLLPGDEELIETTKARIWEASVDGLLDDEVGFVRERARTLLSRQLTIRNTRAWVDAARYRLRAALAEYDMAVPPVDHRFAEGRLRDLLYYVLRDLIGYGKLTIPVRDPTLEDIEANRVGDRIKVVPRAETGHNERAPTNLVFESEREFVNVVTKLAADDGTELNASTPSAKVNLRPEGVDETIRCAVALGTISEDGPHISIRKQAPDPMTPVDLVERDAISTELVALLWLLYEHHGVVLFCGPTGVGKTTLMNAHMPFIPFGDRPISIDEGSREVYIPHETGVSLSTRDHEREHREVTMADLMTECNYLNPDVEVIAEVNTPESFATFAETLNTGHGLVGTTHADDVETLVNRIVEQGLPPYLLREIDLLVFPKRVGEERYVGEVVEIVHPSRYTDLDRPPGRKGVVEKDGTAIHWAAAAWREDDGTFAFAWEHPERANGPADRASGSAERTDGSASTDGSAADTPSDGSAGARGSDDGLAAESVAAEADPQTDDPGAHSGNSTSAPPEHARQRDDVPAQRDEPVPREADGGAGNPAGQEIAAFERLAADVDTSESDVQDAFLRRHRYVQYLVREEVTDADELFAVLADLTTNEAATVERFRRETSERGDDAGS